MMKHGMRAHELLAWMPVDYEDYGRIVAAVKFDMGEVEKVDALSKASSGSFSKLPAPICLFQVNGPAGATDFYLAVQEGIGARWRLFGVDADGVKHPNVEVVLLEDGLTRARPIEDRFGRFSDFSEKEIVVIKCMKAMAAAIEVFSCCNVVTVEHQPPKFINAKRMAKGKVPFFSYRTLCITGDGAAKGEACGGTHASPRLHLRRGHIRRLPDRKVWVRASLVGDKSKGFAMKDYRVAA